MVENNTNTQAAPKENNYCVCVDGTDHSEVAFQVCMNGLFRPNIDKFNVATITNCKKEYLPFHFKPEYIEEKYQAKIYADVASGSAKFHKREIVEGQTTKEALWNLAQELQATHLVVAMHGRKGPKEDLTIAGSSVNFLAQQGLPVVIIKDDRKREEARGKMFRFGALYDRSTQAKQALKVVLDMMAAHDKLVTISCTEPNVSHQGLEDEVKAICGDREVQCIFLEREDANQSVYKRIKQYLVEQSNEDNYVDFVALGNRGINFTSGKEEDKIGTVGKAIIAARKMNCIFVPCSGKTTA